MKRWVKSDLMTFYCLTEDEELLREQNDPSMSPNGIK